MTEWMNAEELAALPRHRLSAVWGDLDAGDMAALALDVAARGVEQPIILGRDGDGGLSVVDGWHRARAAAAADAGADVEIVGLEDAGLENRIVALNSLRRMLSKGEAAIALARLRLNEDGQARASVDADAQLLGCKRRTIQAGRAIVREERGLDAPPGGRTAADVESIEDADASFRAAEDVPRVTPPTGPAVQFQDNAQGEGPGGGGPGDAVSASRNPAIPQESRPGPDAGFAPRPEVKPQPQGVSSHHVDASIGLTVRQAVRDGERLAAMARGTALSRQAQALLRAASRMAADLPVQYRRTVTDLVSCRLCGQNLPPDLVDGLRSCCAGCLREVDRDVLVNALRRPL